MVLYSLKHLSFLPFFITLKQDLKWPFLSFGLKKANYNYLRYLSLGALRENK